VGIRLRSLGMIMGMSISKKNMHHLCEECGIQIHYSTPYTPQQNGVAERKNRYFKEMATCMIEEMDISPKIWA